MITREEIIADNPIEDVIRSYGVTLTPVKNKPEMLGICPLHNEKTPSFYVNIDKQTFHCFGCGAGGSVIDFVEKKENISIGSAMEKLSIKLKNKNESNLQRHGKVGKPQSPNSTYDYIGINNNVCFSVERFESPKRFIQCHHVNDRKVYSMDGVQRILYRLPQISVAQRVVITEGEKDVETLVSLGYEATCNPGGAGKWLEGYTETLVGKEIIIIPDNDEPGRKHAELVSKSLSGKAKSIKIVNVPVEYKDISEWVSADKDAKENLEKLIQKTSVLGLDIPIYSMDEMRESYKDFITTVDKKILNFSWLPELNDRIRGIVPGEVIAILGSTGAGKTAIVQNIAYHAAPLKVLFFELELADPLIFERFTQIKYNINGVMIEDSFKMGSEMKDLTEGLNHIYTCPISKMTPQLIEEYIIKSEMKIGERPKVVIVDYIGLVTGTGTSRYEKTSMVAEEMKRIAKSTQTIIIITSQIHRKAHDESKEISLNDAKDSGSIENSAGLVLGAWRQEDTRLAIKILKNTKGDVGYKCLCDFDGPSLRITPSKDAWKDYSPPHKND